MITRRKVLTLTASVTATFLSHNSDNLVPIPWQTLTWADDRDGIDNDFDLIVKIRAISSQVHIFNGPKTKVWSYQGEVLQGNPASLISLDVATRVYRLRVLNGSNARAYNLAWSDGTPMTILGTDGGLLSEPWVSPTVMLGPGERLDIWADFSKYAVGDRLRLLGQAFDDGSSQIMPGRGRRGMMGGNPELPNGAALSLMTVRIVEQAVESRTLPTQLSKDKGLNPDDALNSRNPRKFKLGMSLYHCHNLEHRYAGMMRNYLIQANTTTSV